MKEDKSNNCCKKYVSRWVLTLKQWWRSTSLCVTEKTAQLVIMRGKNIWKLQNILNISNSDMFFPHWYHKDIVSVANVILDNGSLWLNGVRNSYDMHTDFWSMIEFLTYVKTYCKNMWIRCSKHVKPVFQSKLKSWKNLTRTRESAYLRQFSNFWFLKIFFKVVIYTS